MFKVVCNRQTLCVSPTYRGAEKYIKQMKKKDNLFNKKCNYEIIEEVLEIEKGVLS